MGFTMHRIISAIVLLVISGVSLNAVSASKKATICHKGREISVNMSAMSAHENHGDSLGECDETPAAAETGTETDTTAAVVMMRCEAMAGTGVTVVSFSSSFDLASIQPVEPANCAVALAELLDIGFELRSVTGGSSGDSNSLQLYTDYLLIGKVLPGQP
jgi:hypothetical protein